MTKAFKIQDALYNNVKNMPWGFNTYEYDPDSYPELADLQKWNNGDNNWVRKYPTVLQKIDAEIKAENDKLEKHKLIFANSGGKTRRKSKKSKKSRKSRKSLRRRRTKRN